MAACLAPCGEEDVSPCAGTGPGSTSCLSDQTIATSSDRTENGHILHKVTKLDTLAGLAIKYRVTVSDIKRANGILSDNAMFAREHVKIPTGSMPMSEESQVLLARLMSGYGRDASLNARERKAPGTVSITQLPGSPTSACRSSFFGSDAVDDDPGTPYSRRSDKSSSEPGDVELIERSTGDGGGGGAAAGYGSDRVRRRTRHDSSSCSGGRYGHSQLGQQQFSQAAEAAVGWLSHAAAGAAAAAQAALPAAASCLPPAARRSFNNAALADSRTWDQLACAISQGGSSLVDKIRRAASQPSLGLPPLPAGQQSGAPGSSDGADAPLLRASLVTSPAGATPGMRASLSSIGLGLTPSRKDTKGD